MVDLSVKKAQVPLEVRASAASTTVPRLEEELGDI